MILTTDSSMGFDIGSVDTAFYDKFYNVISTVVHKDPSYTDDFWYNIHTLGSDSNYLFEMLWAMLHRKLSNKTYCKFMGNKLRYEVSAENTDTNYIKNQIRYNNDNINRDETSFIGIDYYYCYKGATTLINGIDNAGDEFNRLKNVELALTEDRYHKVRVIVDDTNTIHIISNKFDPATSIFKIIGLLPCYCDTIKAVVETNNELYDFCKALYECDGDGIKNLIDKFLPTMLAEKEQIALENFKKLMLNSMKGQANALHEMIVSQQSHINSLYESVRAEEEKLYKVQLQYTATQLLPATIDEQAVNLLKTSSTIKLLNCDSNYAYLQVKVPITNYNIKDVEMWYKHPDLLNAVTQTPWLAQLIKETFIDGKYQMILTTNVDMPWTSGVQWRVAADNSTQMGNPHLTRYKCFSQTQNAVAKYLREGKVLMALNAIIACCASIAFTDAAVVNYFMMAITTTCRNVPSIKNVETGKMFSPENYRTMYELTQATVAS